MGSGKRFNYNVEISSTIILATTLTIVYREYTPRVTFGPRYGPEVHGLESLRNLVGYSVRPPTLLLWTKCPCPHLHSVTH